MPKIGEEWRQRYIDLEAKAAELLVFLESVETSDNESDLATLIDSDRRLYIRMYRAMETLHDRRS